MAKMSDSKGGVCETRQVPCAQLRVLPNPPQVPCWARGIVDSSGSHYKYVSKHNLSQTADQKARAVAGYPSGSVLPIPAGPRGLRWVR